MNSKSHQLKIVIGLSLVFATLILISVVRPIQTQLPDPQPPVAPQAAQQTEYTFTAQRPMTAQLLLETGAVVEFTDFGTAGNFVRSINGLAGDDEHFWAFYVNDEFAQAGVGQTNLQTGDTIRFVYEKIEPLQ